MIKQVCAVLPLDIIVNLPANDAIELYRFSAGDCLLDWGYSYDFQKMTATFMVLVESCSPPTIHSINIQQKFHKQSKKNQKMYKMSHFRL